MKYSTIIFEVKKKLGLSIREYIFLDATYHLQVKTGVSYAKNDYYAELLEISVREVQKIKAKMIALGFAHSKASGDGLQTTDIWNNVYLGTEEMKKPKKEKKEATFSVLGADIIKALEVVDPKNKLYYNNKTQREACDFLIEEYTFETVIKAISFYNLAKGKVRFLPSISTPCELRDKWTKLQGVLERQHAENSEHLNSSVPD
jgi:hypothetical protein